MTVWELTILAKCIAKLEDEGLHGINNGGKPEVYLDPRAFHELFPACWHDDEPFESSTGKTLFKRSIRIDGVDFMCIKEVTNG